MYYKYYKIHRLIWDTLGSRYFLQSLFILKVCGGLQDIDSHSLGVERHKVLSEFILGVRPVDEVEVSRLGFMFELAGCPVIGVSRFHIGHCPDNFGGLYCPPHKSTGLHRIPVDS